ncbi:MAG: 1,2-dihydroxy-3-keto-5-methylthiopentene dioxygenase [Myxococcota bacterium]
MEAFWLDTGDAMGAAELRSQGVLYDRLPTDPRAYQGSLDDLKAQRGYVEQDEVSLSPETPDLDAVCAKFLDEHLHDEDEVRFVLSGEGVFDIRSRDDRWMRVKVETGDLIVVPEKRYHRFMLTDRKQIRCVRLFKDRSGWTPHYRGPFSADPRPPTRTPP